ncbi:MAG: hypothetical protein EA350_04400 [Gemmatimonadales bacterium]|nr:MAG: hypothetical protein EA350_04400 [Gemmatimonadales bacterium]
MARRRLPVMRFGICFRSSTGHSFRGGFRFRAAQPWVGMTPGATMATRRQPCGAMSTAEDCENHALPPRVRRAAGDGMIHGSTPCQPLFGYGSAREGTINGSTRRIRLRALGFEKWEIDFLGLEALPDSEVLEHLSHRSLRSLRNGAMNGWVRYLLSDKWITQMVLDRMGIPGPKLYGLFHPRFGRTVTGSPLAGAEAFASVVAEDLPADGSPLRLFLKPQCGEQGRGARGWRLTRLQDGGIVVEGRHGTAPLARALEDLSAETPRMGLDSPGRGWIVQRFVEQHPEVMELSPGSVCTVRAVTCLDVEGRPTLQRTTFRVGRHGSETDNVSGGGVGLSVDPATGILGAGRHAAAEGGARVTRHPDSGIPFEGRRLPMWPELRDLCLRVAQVFPEARWVGWDVALSRTGPVVIEGNAFWAGAYMQAHGAGLLDGPNREALAGHGLTFPERVPGLARSLAILLARRLRRRD